MPEDVRSYADQPGATVKRYTFPICTGPGPECRNKGNHGSVGQVTCGNTDSDHPDDPASELDRRARTLVVEHGFAYDVALQRVMSHPDNAEIVAEYHQATNTRPATKPTKDDP
jgi:hypothetical protein